MKVYAILDGNGKLRRSLRTNHLMVYTSNATARRAAQKDGDSVVEAEIDLTKEPLFIRRKVVPPVS